LGEPEKIEPEKNEDKKVEVEKQSTLFAHVMNQREDHNSSNESQQLEEETRAGSLEKPNPLIFNDMRIPKPVGLAPFNSPVSPSTTIFTVIEKNNKKKPPPKALFPKKVFNVVHIHNNSNEVTYNEIYNFEEFTVNQKQKAKKVYRTSGV
jgi:hypothetical protein